MLDNLSTSELKLKCFYYLIFVIFMDLIAMCVYIIENLQKLLSLDV